MEDLTSSTKSTPLWASDCVPGWTVTNMHRQWRSISFHKQSLQWVILSLWNFSVTFGDSITFHLFFLCLNSQVHEARQLWNYWNNKARAYVCLLNNWNSWQTTKVPIIRYMEAWLGNTMQILGCHGRVCPVVSGQDWFVTHRSPSRQERAVIAHTLTRLSLLQASWLQEDMAYPCYYRQAALINLLLLFSNGRGEKVILFLTSAR